MEIYFDDESKILTMYPKSSNDNQNYYLNISYGIAWLTNGIFQLNDGWLIESILHNSQYVAKENTLPPLGRVNNVLIPRGTNKNRSLLKGG